MVVVLTSNAGATDMILDMKLSYVIPYVSCRRNTNLTQLVSD